MKYWKMPEELRKKVEKFLQDKKQANNNACKQTKTFFKTNFNHELEIKGMDTHANYGFVVDWVDYYELENNKNIKENFRFLAKEHPWLKPKSKGKIAKTYKKLHDTFGLEKFTPMEFAELLNALPIHFSVKFEKINDELVITEHMGVPTEKIGLEEIVI